MRHCAWKLCGKRVHVELSLSVNCENLFRPFLFPVLKSALVAWGFVYILSARLSSFSAAFKPNVWCFWFGTFAVPKTPLRSSGLALDASVWMDGWLFRSVFFFLFMLEVIKCGSAHICRPFLKWFWSFCSLFYHLCLNPSDLTHQGRTTLIFFIIITCFVRF